MAGPRSSERGPFFWAGGAKRFAAVVAPRRVRGQGELRSLLKGVACLVSGCAGKLPAVRGASFPHGATLDA
ncbi:hypothetical protein SAMN04488026_103346 [Aliiruegeria lutimaris]|uniref:Uncharacterized protein n=1 Tax=Aliiruegeria lutimaris TaxID=571298 RepID=A0A1G8ZUJ3_9RHOB|nr:hypothetical protein SAMN04488026_103346 [Aliiruegeria lutimaris]